MKDLQTTDTSGPRVQGTSADDVDSFPRAWEGEPRKSWLMRKRRERAALRSGLAEWQANPYYCAGRVTVPAILDTFACQCFFNKWGPGLRWAACKCSLPAEWWIDGLP